MSLKNSPFLPPIAGLSECSWNGSEVYPERIPQLLPGQHYRDEDNERFFRPAASGKRADSFAG